MLVSSALSHKLCTNGLSQPSVRSSTTATSCRKTVNNRFGKNPQKLLTSRPMTGSLSSRIISVRQGTALHAKPWWKFWDGANSSDLSDLDGEDGEDGELEYEEKEVEVSRILGVRYLRGKDTKIQGIEYLIRWKDDKEDTWEVAQNVAEDLLRDYEADWWKAAKSGADFELREYLACESELLAQAEDKDRRTALHYTAGLGKAPACKVLLEAGADPNALDKDGYTPLHIAAGYVHAQVVRDLLTAGGDPEIRDRKGQTVMDLIFDQKRRLPANNPQFFRRRNALEDVSMALYSQLYDEVPVAAVLDKRTVRLRDGKIMQEDEEVAEGELVEVQYKVRWADWDPSQAESASTPVEAKGSEEAADGEEETEAEKAGVVVEDDGCEWVISEFLAQDLIDDWENGVEYCEAEKVLETRFFDGANHYLVQWSDGSANSWESEENVAEVLIKNFQAVQTEHLKIEDSKPKKQQNRQGGGKSKGKPDQKDGLSYVI